MAYITALPEDPFIGRKSVLPWLQLQRETYSYWGGVSVEIFASASLGQDIGRMPGFETQEKRSRIKWLLYSDGPDHQSTNPSSKYLEAMYDPTNGTVSKGDIYRWGP